MPKERLNGKCNRFIFLLLSLSAVIGIGNYWKFAEYSHRFKGAFLIAYILAILAVGLPLLIFEFTASRRYKSDIRELFSKAKPLSNFGWFVVLSSLLIAVYYSILLSWNIIYFFISFGTPWKENPSAYFANNVLQLSSGISHIGTIVLPVFIALLLAWVIIFFVIRKGAETMKKASWLLLPACIALIIIFLMIILPLNGSLKGISHFLDIDMGSFYSIEIWKNAFTQALLSLGLALGFFTALSSKNREGFILGDSIIIALFKTMFMILIGFAIFGSIGVLSENNGIPLEKMQIDHRSSNFVLLPELASLTSYPTLTSLVLFLSFLIISLLGSAFVIGFVCSSLSKKFNTDCQKLAIIICGAGFLLGVVFTTRAGFYFLDLLEHFVYNYSILVIALMECILAGWLLRRKELIDYINKNSKIRIGGLWEKSVKFIVTAVLLITTALLIVKDAASLYNNYPLIAVLIAWAFIVMPLIIVFLIPRR